MASCSPIDWVIPVYGDAIRRRVTIDRSASGVPDGVTITKAWLTVKSAVADADPGLFQKVVTTTDAPGTGQIEQDGSGSGGTEDFVVRFDLTRANTVAIGVVTATMDGRFFDVQVLASDGNPYTAEFGKVWVCNPEVTVATS